MERKLYQECRPEKFCLNNLRNPQLRESLLKRQNCRASYVHYNDDHTDIWHDDWHDTHVNNWTDIN